MSKYINLSHYQILVSVLKEFLKELLGLFLDHGKITFLSKRFYQIAVFSNFLEKVSVQMVSVANDNE